MNRPLILLVLVTVLAACGAPAQVPSAALPTITTAATARVPVTPYLTAAPSSAPSSTPAPSASASTQPTTATAPTAAALSGDPTSLPVAIQAVVWHGLRFQYDSNRYHFAETAAYTTDPRPQATASLSYTTDCPPNIADCAIAAAFLALYSRDGRDFWTWLAQQTIVSSADPVAGFSDDVVAGQPAAFWRSTGLEGSTIVVSVGEDVLIIVGVESDAVTQMIQMEPPNAIPLTAGQIATTTPDRTWELWSDATGGARVVERPQLYGGAFVSILAVEPQAVQVRTPEGVTGWIHAAAPAALSTRLAIGGEYARMLHTFQAQIAQGHAVPVRESPRSTANQRGDLLTPGQQVTVVSVRGDWLQVYSDAGPGWVRWYYDGTQYVDIVDQPQ